MVQQPRGFSFTQRPLFSNLRASHVRETPESLVFGMAGNLTWGGIYGEGGRWLADRARRDSQREAVLRLMTPLLTA